MKLSNEEIEGEFSWARDMMKIRKVERMLDAPPFLIEPEFQKLLGRENYGNDIFKAFLEFNGKDKDE